MILSELKTGEKGVIVKVLGHGAFRKRIIEMGFVKGKVVEVILNAPLKDPIKYKILDYEVSLRRNEAAMIEVIPLSDLSEGLDYEVIPAIESDEKFINKVQEHSKSINIALVGNPNCGKTSLFNIASGAKEHVGNYSGVTVDAKEGKFVYKGYTFNIFDLPGTYSLSAYSPEELYVRRHLVEKTPDVIINVVAASNLERNLYLTTQLIDMDLRMVIALNMYDELINQGAKLDYTTLEKLIGVPIVPTSSKYEKGIEELFDQVIQVYESKHPVVRHIHVNHGALLEECISLLKDRIKQDESIEKHFSPRYLAIKLLEDDKEVKNILKNSSQYESLTILQQQLSKRIQESLKEDAESAITDSKYGFISGALKETLTPGQEEENRITKSIDEIVTGKLLGFPIFFAVLWLMFQTTFSLGQYPMDWIDALVGFIGNLMSKILPIGPLHDLIVDGIIGGVGGVIVFLPNILILYFFISLMEDSGYMARVAFIMDKVMHKMGLHGKSFIPLVMGFGCTVPSIMASRTIEDPKSRLITMLINPLISCSARLPIYILVVGTFFPMHATLVLMSLYILGIVFAVIMARIFRKYLFKGEDSPFVMELPPYRMPTLKNTVRHMWDKAKAYLNKMGGVILVASIIIWFLGYFPRTAPDTKNYSDAKAKIEEQYVAQKPLYNGIRLDSLQNDYNKSINHLNNLEEISRQRNSYIGRVGVFFEPIFKPLGFNWKINICLISGIAAKELVVSTLGVLYAGNTGDNDGSLEQEGSLSDKLREINPSTGKPDFTPLIALSFLVFVLLYFPCIATITAIINESGSLKWGIFAIGYTTALAWLVSFVVYQIGNFIF
ncbi:MAG: ferrous iron transport protein B [Bacteroidales bacterium]|nr:ferrous iron transport protein B [Bacteroidales bacterium]